MNLLVFSAHSADFCSRAGGVIAKHAQRGDKVRVVSLSYGERSESGGLYGNGQDYSLQEIRDIRHAEATQAAEILGAEIRFLDWGDLSFEYSIENVHKLAQEVRDFRPDQVLTHHGPDPVSIDHDTTWHLTMRATQVAGAPGIELRGAPTRRPEVLLYEATVPLTEVEGFNPDVYVDITDVWDTKLAALRAFGKAQGFLEPWYTDVAKRRAFQAQRLCRNSGIVYAEAFGRATPWVGAYLPESLS